MMLILYHHHQHHNQLNHYLLQLQQLLLLLLLLQFKIKIKINIQILQQMVMLLLLLIFLKRKPNAPALFQWRRSLSRPTARPNSTKQCTNVPSKTINCSSKSTTSAPPSARSSKTSSSRRRPPSRESAAAAVCRAWSRATSASRWPCRRSSAVSSATLLTLVQNLDEQIKASEAARQYAEEKLIEMALQKIDVTEALKKVDDALEKGRHAHARRRQCRQGARRRTSSPQIRRDVLGAHVDDAPAASAHPDAAAAATATAAAAAAAQKRPRAAVCSSQIRAGVQLSRVDVEKLKEATTPKSAFARRVESVRDDAVARADAARARSKCASSS
jgi:hypothetical protein